MYRYFREEFDNAADVDIVVLKLNRAPETQLPDGRWVFAPTYRFGDASISEYGEESAANCTEIGSFEARAIGYPKDGDQPACSSIGPDFCQQKTSPGTLSCAAGRNYAFRRFAGNFDTCAGSSGGPVLRASDNRVVAVNNAQGFDENGDLTNFAVRVRQFSRFRRSHDEDFDCQPPGGGVDISCLIGKMATNVG